MLDLYMYMFIYIWQLSSLGITPQMTPFQPIFI